MKFNIIAVLALGLAPPTVATHPPLSSISSLLFVAAEEEYNTDAVFHAAMDHEWKGGEGRRLGEVTSGGGGDIEDKDKVASILCSSATSSNPARPFMGGSKRAAALQDVLGTMGLKTMYNGDDMTCWKAWMTADQATSIVASDAQGTLAHPELTIHPISHAVRLPSSFLASTVGVTPEEKSKVATTAHMFTLELCPTATTGAALSARLQSDVAQLFTDPQAHARHTDSFFWTSPNAPTSTSAHASRYIDALATTAGGATGGVSPHCHAALPLLDYSPATTTTGGSHHVHIANVGAFHAAVTAAATEAAADACFLTLATYLTTAIPELCALHPRGAIELKNTAAQWIVQSGDATSSGKRPFWDAGLKGEGQIVAVTDTGLAEDNCYFSDATGMVTPANDATSFDLSKRKVVQVSCKERTRAHKSAHSKTQPPSLFTHVCGAHKQRRFLFSPPPPLFTHALWPLFAHVLGLCSHMCVQYYNWVDSLDEEGGHGTHVCGSIVGHKSTTSTKGGESTGYADGVAKNAKVAFFDLGLGHNLFGSPEGPLSGTQCPNEDGCLWTPGNIPQFLDPGYNAGARLHSASWGDMTTAITGGYRDSNTYKFMDASFDEYMNVHDDFLLLIAAGNDGEVDGPNTPNTVGSPSTAKNVVCVGASNNLGSGASNWGGQNSLAMFSSRGPSADGRMKPDLVSPGFFILSAAARNGETGECDPANEPSNGDSLYQLGGLTFMAGTSMATPVTSGAAALVRQYFTAGFYPTGSAVNANKMGSPSGALIKAVLMNSAQAISTIPSSSGTTNTNVYDNNQGFGLTSLDKALALSGNDLNTWIVDREVLAEGETYGMEFTAKSCSASSEFSVTLAYTDRPGVPNCKAGCMINDLDLLVTKSGSGSTFPNGRSSRDSVNNVERVRVSASPGDVFAVTVNARNLGDGVSSQKFSLVASGCFDTALLDTQSPTQAPTMAPGNTASPTEAPVTESPTNSAAPTSAPASGNFCEQYIEYKGLKLTGHDASVDSLNGDTAISEQFHKAVADVGGEYVKDDSWVCYTKAADVIREEVEGDPNGGWRRKLWNRITGRELTIGYETMDVTFTVTMFSEDESCDPNSPTLAAVRDDVHNNLARGVFEGGLQDALRTQGNSEGSWLKTAVVDGANFEPVTDSLGNFVFLVLSKEQDRKCTNWRMQQWLREHWQTLIGGTIGGLVLCCVCCGVGFALVRSNNKRKRDKYSRKPGVQMRNNARMPAKSPMHTGTRGQANSAGGPKKYGGPPPPSYKASQGRNAAPAGRNAAPAGKGRGVW